MYLKEHCCSLMQDFLEENKVAIGYSKKLRAYYIDLKTSKIACQTMYFCPWCGKKLPKILEDEYDQAISVKLSIPIGDITLETYDDPRLPLEFKTDEWWKKRGL